MQSPPQEEVQSDSCSGDEKKESVNIAVAQTIVNSIDVSPLDLVKISISALLNQLNDSQEIAHKIKSKKSTLTNEQVRNLGKNLHTDLHELQGRANESLQIIEEILSKQNHFKSQDVLKTEQGDELTLLQHKVEYLKAGMKTMAEREIGYQMRIKDFEQQAKNTQTKVRDELSTVNASPIKNLEYTLKLFQQKEQRYAKEIELLEAKLARTEEKNAEQAEEIRNLKKDIRQAKLNMDNQNNTFQKTWDKEVALLTSQFKSQLIELMKEKDKKMEELAKVHRNEKANIQNTYQQEILLIQQEFEGQYHTLHDKMHQMNQELHSERSKFKSELAKHKQAILNLEKLVKQQPQFSSLTTDNGILSSPISFEFLRDLSQEKDERLKEFDVETY